MHPQRTLAHLLEDIHQPSFTLYVVSRSMELLLEARADERLRDRWQRDMAEWWCKLDNLLADIECGIVSDEDARARGCELVGDRPTWLDEVMLQDLEGLSK